MVRKKENGASSQKPKPRNRSKNENQKEKNIEKELEKMNISQKKAENRQKAESTIEQIKNAARKKFNNENHKVVLIKYSEKMTREEIKLLCQVVGQPAWVNCNPIPNPKNGSFYGQIEMASFQEAAELIKVLREANSTISMADWAKEESLHRPKENKNRSAPPGPEHRVLCCYFKNSIDQNSLRNLALRVAQPTAVKALEKPSKQGTYLGFIEMENQELAKELLSQIKSEEKEVTGQWANEPTLKQPESFSVRKHKRAVSQWGDLKAVILISSEALSESQIREMIEPAYEVEKIKLPETSDSKQFFAEIRFTSAENALNFFKSLFENPKKGIRVEPAQNKMETAKHLTSEETEKMIESGELIVGILRVSNGNYNHGFVSDPNGGTDFFLNGRQMQNRALPGDKVAIRILPETQWTKNKLGAPQRTAEVLNILESKSIKRCAGCFAQTNLTGIQANDLLFHPMDSKLPRLMISKTGLSEEQLKQIDEYIEKKIIYQVEITEWEEGASCAKARLVDRIGDPEDIENIIMATLINYGIDTRDLAEMDLDSDLPSSDWSIPDSERKKRRDFRSECIFSIDPATARDLDDALHIKKLPNGNWEVGVHIADVAYFVKVRARHIYFKTNYF